LKSRNSTLAVWSDGHLNYAALLHCGRFENSTTCGDANRRSRWMQDSQNLGSGSDPLPEPCLGGGSVPAGAL